MTGLGRAEAGPYFGPEHPERTGAPVESTPARPTPSRPFVPIHPERVSSGRELTGRRLPTREGARPEIAAPSLPTRSGVPLDTGYEEWGSHGTAVVAPTSRVADAAPMPPARTPSDATEPMSSMRSDEGRAPSTLPADGREAVATALETVALRVRVGELEPLGYEPGMGDAAAVATALTALLTTPR